MANDLGSTHGAVVDYADLRPSLFKLHAGNFYIERAGERDRLRIVSIIPYTPETRSEIPARARGTALAEQSSEQTSDK